MEELKYIKHNAIDFKKWDKTILSSKWPLVFAQSFYLNATSPKWDAMIIGNYESVFPITSKTKYGMKYLPQPSFTSQLGAYGKLNQSIEKQFYEYISKKFKLIEIELNASNTLETVGIKPKNTFIIDYKKEFSYNQNTKRNIAKAQKNNFKVELLDKKEALILSRKYLDRFLRNDLNLSKSDLTTFNNLLINASEAKALVSLKVTDEKKELRALGHFICNGKHTLFLKGTNFDRAENSGSMHLLMDYAINYFSDKALIFDFGGGSNSEGLATFYKGMGGCKLDYSFLRVNKLSPIIKLIKNKK